MYLNHSLTAKKKCLNHFFFFLFCSIKHAAHCSLKLFSFSLGFFLHFECEEVHQSWNWSFSSFHVITCTLKKEKESKAHHFTTKFMSLCRLIWVASRNGFHWICIPWCCMHDLHMIDFICSNRASQFRSVTSSSFIKDAHPDITVVKDLLSTDRKHFNDFDQMQNRNSK